ncbi:MAG: aspartyl protease family protein [Bryobacterales bacterium]|nr:aspartyl protease family protein [Bryobacterales bacterium]
MRLGATAVLFAQIAVCQTTVPVELTNNVPIIRAAIGGRTVVMIVDTGAGVSVIDPGAGLPVRGSASLSGGGGRVHGGQAGPVPVQVGAITSPPVPFAVVDLSTLSQFAGRRIDGILGYHFLREYVAEFDYVAGEFRLHGNDFDPAGWQSLPMKLRDNRPAVRTSLTISAGRSLDALLLVDTGSSSSVTVGAKFAQRQKLPPPDLPAIADTALGIGGRMEIRLGRIDGLTLGPNRLDGPLVRFRTGGGGNDDGLLGGEVLRRFRLALDYRAGKLYLRPGEQVHAPFRPDLSGMRLAWRAPEFNTAVIDSVAPDRAAAKAGLRPGDELLSLNGRALRELNPEDLRKLFRQAGTVRLRILRRGTVTRTVSVEPAGGALPPPPVPPPPGPPPLEKLRMLGRSSPPAKCGAGAARRGPARGRGALGG